MPVHVDGFYNYANVAVLGVRWPRGATLGLNSHELVLDNACFKTYIALVMGAMDFDLLPPSPRYYLDELDGRLKGGTRSALVRVIEELRRRHFASVHFCLDCGRTGVNIIREGYFIFPPTKRAEFTMFPLQTHSLQPGDNEAMKLLKAMYTGQSARAVRALMDTYASRLISFWVKGEISFGIYLVYIINVLFKPFIRQEYILSVLRDLEVFYSHIGVKEESVKILPYPSPEIASDAFKRLSAYLRGPRGFSIAETVDLIQFEKHRNVSGPGVQLGAVFYARYTQQMYRQITS